MTVSFPCLTGRELRVLFSSGDFCRTLMCNSTRIDVLPVRRRDFGSRIAGSLLRQLLEELSARLWPESALGILLVEPAVSTADSDLSIRYPKLALIPVRWPLYGIFAIRGLVKLHDRFLAGAMAAVENQKQFVANKGPGPASREELAYRLILRDLSCEQIQRVGSQSRGAGILYPLANFLAARWGISPRRTFEQFLVDVPSQSSLPLASETWNVSVPADESFEELERHLILFGGTAFQAGVAAVRSFSASFSRNLFAALVGFAQWLGGLNIDSAYRTQVHEHVLDVILHAMLIEVGGTVGTLRIAQGNDRLAADALAQQRAFLAHFRPSLKPGGSLPPDSCLHFPHFLRRRYESFERGELPGNAFFSGNWKKRFLQHGRTAVSAGGGEEEKESNETGPLLDRNVAFAYSVLQYVYPWLRRLPPYRDRAQSRMQGWRMGVSYLRFLDCLERDMQGFLGNRGELFLAAGDFIQDVGRYLGRREFHGAFQRVVQECGGFLNCMGGACRKTTFGMRSLLKTGFWRVRAIFRHGFTRLEDDQKHKEWIDGLVKDLEVALLAPWAPDAVPQTSFGEPDALAQRSARRDGPFLAPRVFGSNQGKKALELLLAALSREHIPATRLVGCGRKGSVIPAALALMENRPFAMAVLRPAFDVSPRVSWLEDAVLIDDVAHTGYNLSLIKPKWKTSFQPVGHYVPFLATRVLCEILPLKASSGQEEDSAEPPVTISRQLVNGLKRASRGLLGILGVSPCTKGISVRDADQTLNEYVAGMKRTVRKSKPFLRYRWDFDERGNLSLRRLRRSSALTKTAAWEVARVQRLMERRVERGVRLSVKIDLEKALRRASRCGLAYPTRESEERPEVGDECFVSELWRAKGSRSSAHRFASWLWYLGEHLLFEPGAKYKPSLVFSHPRLLWAIGAYYHERLCEYDNKRPRALVVNSRLAIPFAVAIALHGMYGKRRHDYWILLANENASYVTGLDRLLGDMKEKGETQLVAASVTHLTAHGAFESDMNRCIRNCCTAYGVEFLKTATCSLFDVRYLRIREHQSAFGERGLIAIGSLGKYPWEEDARSKGR